MGVGPLQQRSAIVSMVVLIVCVVAAGLRLGVAPVRRPALNALGRELFSSRREGFANSIQLPPNWRPDKSQILVSGGLHFVFSDGSFAVGNTALLQDKVYVAPSRKDAVCKYTQQGSQVDCNNVFIEEYAVPDARPVKNLKVVCESHATSVPVLNPEDSTVRILSAKYNLTKLCVTLTNAVLATGSATDGAVKLLLPQSENATKLFVLARPVFVCTESSALYSVSYSPVDYVKDPNSVVDYDSTRRGAVAAVLRPVASTVGGVKYQMTRNGRLLGSDAAEQVNSSTESSVSGPPPAPKPGTVNAPELAMTLFYVTPNEPLNEQPGTAISMVEAFCLFVPRLDRTGLLWAFGGLSLRAEGGDDNNHYSLTLVGAAAAGTPAPQVQVPRAATVLLSYSTNLVVVTYVDYANGRVGTKRFGGMTALNLSSANSRSGITKNTLSSSFAEPFDYRTPVPLFNLSVPSGLDFLVAQGRVTDVLG